MKAFRVTFNTAGTRGFSEVVLAKDDEFVEKALEAKRNGYDSTCQYCNIYRMKEVPLSQVKVGELSITEVMMLLGGTVNENI